MNAHAVSTPHPPGRDDAPPETEWVHRFGLTERFAHWWTVSMVTVAILTGLTLGDDRSGGWLGAHITSVALIGVGLAAALVFGDHRAVLRAMHELFTFEPRDLHWFREHARHPLAHEHPDESGMFNPAQKVLAWGLAIALAVVIVTGVLSWASVPGGGLHGGTVVVAAVLLGAHIFMAVVNPATRPALAGMVYGRVRRSWAAHHHARWLRDIEHQGHR